ncbi:MAG: type II secretion system F family protein [Acidimicrobiia bacterium]
MSLGLVLGVGIAAGVLMLVSGLVPARPGLSDALADLHRPRDRQTAQPEASLFVRVVGRPTARSAAGRQVAHRLEPDLRVAGQSADELFARQAICALAGLLWAPATAALMMAGGVHVSWVFPAWISVLFACAGAAIPLVALKVVAADRRRAFRHALGCFLDLVAVRLAGGAGIDSALQLSATTGHGWAFAELRQALAEARLMGQAPWAGLDRLGTQLHVSELNELAASVGLAGDEGARVRRSIAAKARTIRIRGLADAESAAQAASERMSLPIVLLMVGFVIFLGYPAVHQVLTGL